MSQPAEFEHRLRALESVLTERVDVLTERVGVGFERMDLGFATVQGQLDRTAAGQQVIVDLLTRLIDQPTA